MKQINDLFFSPVNGICFKLMIIFKILLIYVSIILNYNEVL